MTLTQHRYSIVNLLESRTTILLVQTRRTRGGTRRGDETILVNTS